jgi:3-methyladenine DNA glycosylase AlkD
MWYDEMFGELESQKDEEQAAKMSAYMKNHFPFLGLPKPKLAAIIKPYIKKAAKEENIDWDFVDACWRKDYREAQYAGVEYLIVVQNKLTEHDLEKLKELIVTKS